MIKRWIITGDTHGQVERRVYQILHNMDGIVPGETAVIILGDAGINFYLNKTDRKNKKQISALGLRVYCVRGNHEARPSNIDKMILVADPDVGGKVYMEEEFPLIRYFVDGGEYTIADKKTLVVGGAYSVDKYYRLSRAKGGGFSGWFEDEQLSAIEMEEIQKNVAGKRYDLVLTHTAPITWEPTDLFLRGIDQSSVDKTMEHWLKELALSITWGHWLFGHYHADRIEAPHVEQFYYEYEDLEDIINRWKQYDETGELDWWLPKSPYMKEEEAKNVRDKD